jgi:hypothetical protein
LLSDDPPCAQPRPRPQPFPPRSRPRESSVDDSRGLIAWVPSRRPIDAFEP